MSATLTLITCTRNPDPNSFRRVLAGVAALERPADHDIEYLVIDSTSEPPVASREAVREFLGRSPWARVIRSPAPGLAAARRAGIEASKGALIVWFDDDNVPAPDYLAHVVRTAAERPTVSVWGAGAIDVEFTSPVPAWAEHPADASISATIRSAKTNRRFLDPRSAPTPGNLSSFPA